MSDASRPADVLLVEDNPGDVRLTKEALKQGEVETRLHVVRDGVEAIDYLAKRGDYAEATTPDVVLLDLNLPRKGGEEVLAAIHEDPSLPNLPVIVLTSSEATEDVARTYELSANAYLTKPVKPDEFIETVKCFEEFWLSAAQLPPEEC